MNCPRCGRPQPPDAEPSVFCAHCGQFLVPTRWVATPPPGAGPADPGVPRPRYAGPPRYAEVPRWGFPAQPWRPAPDGAADGAPRPAPARVVEQAGLLVPLLRGLAVLAAVSGAAEVWRYVLLLDSRDEALSASAVAASDALVVAASLVTTLTFLGVGACLLRWVLALREAAAERSGRRPARADRWVLLGWLVPGLNLSIPGSTLAEVEHTALDRPADERPRPSRLLLLWWALWAANVLFAACALIWRFRTGVQAQADGVELHALCDLLAAATAVVTARVVLWLTALVSPPRPTARETVVAVGDRAEPDGPWRRRRRSRRPACTPSR
jgi:hypothetical protein